MKLIEVHALAAKLVKEGKTNAEVRKALFNMKCVRIAQINEAMKVYEA